MRTPEQYYQDRAANTADTIGGRLLRGYFSRMAEHEAVVKAVDMPAVRASRTHIRAEYRAAAKAAATHQAVREVAPGVKATCFIFADGSRLRADSFN